LKFLIFRILGFHYARLVSWSQVGAGTMNPLTFLRVLGPEPWNVAYVCLWMQNFTLFFGANEHNSS